MIFNSLKFLIFFPTVVLIYFSLPRNRIRYFFLLCASYYFYMSWNPKYVFLILASTIITYATSLWIGNTASKQKRKIFLITSLVLNLAILIIFKYFNFLNNSISVILQNFNYQWGIPNVKFLLPIGISFYTLQALGYTIDVYRGDKEPEKDILVYALYVSFFPQLVAGPIERSRHLIPQFHRHYAFDYNRIASGLKLMAWGFFKKVVVADRLALLVDAVHNDLYSYTGLHLIIFIVFFAFQIFCDFSGYSDIAIGSARVMGFDIMKNFDRPFHSKSIAELWRRWHISLSTWFRDYVYIPLGGNRVSKTRHYINLMITFVASGLWHGAAWTYALWGGLHGLFVIISIPTKNFREKVSHITGLSKLPRVQKFLQVITVFTLFCVALIFFRASNLNEALYIVTHMFVGLGDQILNIFSFKFNVGMKPENFVISLVVLVFMEVVHFMQRKIDINRLLSQKPVYIRFAVYYMFIMVILSLGEFGSKAFIYFQF